MHAGKLLVEKPTVSHLNIMSIKVCSLNRKLKGLQEAILENKSDAIVVTEIWQNSLANDT